MSLILSAATICERALRAIHAFPISESAADVEDMREAMHWLDLILAEAVGVKRMFSRLTPSLLSMEITNGTQEYDLTDALGEDAPADGIQFVTQAWIEDEDGNRTPLTIATLDSFENVPLPAETGKPCMIYLTREDDPTLRIFPTPDADDDTEYTLKLSCQRYAPNVAPGGVSGDAPSDAILHDFGVAWQRWMVLQLAHDIGSGPVRKIAEQSLTRFAAMAANAERKLLAFENRPHDTEDPVCEAWDIGA